MKITVEQAAKLIGASPEFVRHAMREGRLPIGSAVKMSSKWTYNISEGLLNAYLGKERKDGNTV